MPRATYGPHVRDRAKRLFAAIAAFAGGELEGVEQLPLKFSWQENASSLTLVVRTTLRALMELCEKDGLGKPLTKPQIREALNRLEDFLAILEDLRENRQGTEDWHFKLRLWSTDRTDNLNHFEQAWEANRPAKSKEQQAVQTDSNPVAPLTAGVASKQENREQATGFETDNHQSAPNRPTFKPLQMPPLPDYFVERPDHQQPVKDLLLNDDSAAPATLVVSAIHGLGGIGKSVLAARLAHDEAVQTRFCDGVLWATLGQEPDLLSFLSDWIQALGDRDFKPTSISSTSSHLRTLLYDKRILLVVDDVWNPEHVEPFRVGRAGCRVLVTTREAAIPNVTLHNLEEMTAEQSLDLLTKKYSGKLSSTERQQAAILAEEVGHLPLALELAAAQIEDGVLFAELLEDLQAETARLEVLDRLIEVSSAYRKRYSLLASLNLSVQRLSPEQQRQFAWLGILPEDVLVTERVASVLWELQPRQAGTVLRILRSRALLLAGAQQPGQKPTYRIHDVMHDLAKRLLTGSQVPQEPQDLPGLGWELATAHTKFLERYRAQTCNGLWHTLAGDGYIHTQLTWHLEQAGRIEAIHELLQEVTETGQNGWFVACESLGQTANFVTDVARAWRLADEHWKRDPVAAMYWQCRYALIYTSLNSLASNIPPILIAALVEKGVWQPLQGWAYVQQILQAEQRAEAIGAISAHLPEALLREALKLTRQIEDEFARAFALSALVLHLPEVGQEALEVTRQIGGEYSRAEALSALVPHLPQALLPDALEVTRQIGDEYSRAEALRALVPHLPEVVQEALEVTRQIEDESERAFALSALVPHLPEVVQEALEVTRQIGDESEGAFALSALVPHLPQALLPDALEVTRQIGDESERAFALSALVPHLPQALLPDALEVTRQIEHESARAEALSALVPHLPQALLPDALEVTRQIGDESERALALRALVPHLPEVVQEALEVTRQIGDEYSRARALRALVPHLPEVVQEALEVTRQIGDEYSRALALSALVPHLPGVVQEALEVTRQIGDGSKRSLALRALVPHLPQALLPDALEVTRQIGDESKRALALSALVPHLPEVVQEALEVTRQIGDEYSRALALSALVPHLPEVVQEALEVTRQIEFEYSRAEALRALVLHLPEIVQEALEVTRQIEDESERALALSALVPYLPQALLPDALEVTRQIEDESERALALSALVPYLPEVGQEALEVTRQIGFEYSQALALRALVPHLPQALLPDALEVTRQIGDESERALALSALVPHLPEVVQEALEVTRQIEDESERALALRALVPHLPEVVQEALEVTRQIEFEYSRAEALRALVPHLPQALLPDALECAAEIRDPYHKATAFQGLAQKLTFIATTPQFWSEVLHILSALGRNELIRSLPELVLFISALGGKAALEEIVRAMREVCEEWR